MSINYVQFHIGDFLSGTISMNTAEIGGYMMMITAHYNVGEQGLPDNEEKLRTITKADRKTWNKIKEAVLAKFYLENGYWKHVRVIEELQKIKDKSGPGRPKSDQKHEDFGVQSQHKNSTTSGTQLKTKPLKTKVTEKTKPITNNQEPISKKNIQKKEGYSELFLRFWEWFPRQRRGNKDKAWQAWCSAISEGRATEQEIIDGLQRYADSDEVKRGYAKGAAAWLNDDRWEADYSVQPKATASFSPNRKPNYMDELEMGSAQTIEKVRNKDACHDSAWP